jgi:Transcriptional regulatory protein, C terminal
MTGQHQVVLDGWRHSLPGDEARDHRPGDDAVGDAHANTDPFTRTVVVTLTRLRRKLGEPEVIETVVGAGYRLR